MEVATTGAIGEILIAPKFRGAHWSYTERHVEVKGSRLLIETVELTINEVNHSATFQPTDLVVVDGIEYHRESDGITTSVGRCRIWRDWTPLADDLSARKFAYALPNHD